MSNKRKKDDTLGDVEDDTHERQEVNQARSKRRKERVSFSDKNQTQIFDADAELNNEQEVLVEGDRITKVLGEEDQQQWSDDEAEVEPFNLKAENQEGYFDRNGNYVENKMEKGDLEDAWLDEYDEKWAKKVIENKARAEKMDEEKDAIPDKVTLLRTVVGLLDTRESVTAALKRYSGGGAAGKKNAAGKNAGKGAEKSAGKGAEKSADGRDMEKFNKLTEAADALLHGGYNNIYSDRKEFVIQELEDEEANQASSSGSNSQPVMWEYKAQDGSLQGPYTSANMRDWRAQGYFTGDSAVQIRKVKDSKAEQDMFADAQEEAFVSSDTIDFSAYP